MDDKQLLEMAAKAAGIVYNESFGKGMWVGEFYSGKEWNPLTDDGDALRLACDLRFEVKPRWRFVEVNNGVEIIFEDCEDEPTLRYAATRRAITRAAAEIARADASIGKERA